MLCISKKVKKVGKQKNYRYFMTPKEGEKHISSNALDWVSIVPEKLKRILDELTANAGVDVLFGSLVSAVDAEDGTIKSVIAANKMALIRMN